MGERRSDISPEREFLAAELRRELKGRTSLGKKKKKSLPFLYNCTSSRFRIVFTGILHTAIHLPTCSCASKQPKNL